LIFFLFALATPPSGSISHLGALSSTAASLPELYYGNDVVSSIDVEVHLTIAFFSTFTPSSPATSGSIASEVSSSYFIAPFFASFDAHHNFYKNLVLHHNS
jgi:hypothetical protein